MATSETLELMMEKGTLGGCSTRVVDVQLVVWALHIVMISKKRMTRIFLMEMEYLQHKQILILIPCMFTINDEVYFTDRYNHRIRKILSATATELLTSQLCDISRSEWIVHLYLPPRLCSRTIFIPAYKINLLIFVHSRSAADFMPVEMDGMEEKQDLYSH